MRLEEGELVKRLEQGMKSKWNWSLKEKSVQELVWLIWSSWIRKLKRKRKRETLEVESGLTRQNQRNPENRDSKHEH